MAAGKKPGHAPVEPDGGRRGAARSEPTSPDGGPPRTRRWAPRANADAALPPLAELNSYDDNAIDAQGDPRERAPYRAGDLDDAFADHDASESETGEQDRPNLDRIEHSGTEEFSAPSPQPRSGKRRATGPVLMPRDVDGPPRDAVAVPTRIEDPRIDLDLSAARRDEDETSVPPRLRGRNLPAERARDDDDDDAPAEAPARSSDDLMMASFNERSGPRIWIVVAVLAAIGLIALLLGVTR